MELSIQRLSSPPTSSFSLPTTPASPLAPQSTPVTPLPQQPVKPPASHPGQDKPSALATSTPTPVTPPQQPRKPPISHSGRDKPCPALATSTPTHSHSSRFDVGMAIDTPPIYPVSYTHLTLPTTPYV